MNGLARLLAGHTDPGVYHWTSAADARTVEHAAEHAGWRFVALDSWQVEDKSAFLDVCEEAFAFPEWVGHNFDALADALSDVRGPDGAGVVVLWEGWAPLARANRRVSSFDETSTMRASPDSATCERRSVIASAVRSCAADRRSPTAD